jgi:hypothetical protein
MPWYTQNGRKDIYINLIAKSEKFSIMYRYYENDAMYVTYLCRKQKEGFTEGSTMQL